MSEELLDSLRRFKHSGREFEEVRLRFVELAQSYADTVIRPILGWLNCVDMFLQLPSGREVHYGIFNHDRGTGENVMCLGYAHAYPQGDNLSAAIDFAVDMSDGLWEAIVDWIRENPEARSNHRNHVQERQLVGVRLSAPDAKEPELRDDEVRALRTLERAANEKNVETDGLGEAAYCIANLILHLSDWCEMQISLRSGRCVDYFTSHLDHGYPALHLGGSLDGYSINTAYPDTTDIWRSLRFADFVCDGLLDAMAEWFEQQVGDFRSRMSRIEAAISRARQS